MITGALVALSRAAGHGGSTVMRRARQRRKRAIEAAFRHGYHAGLHVGADSECRYPLCKDWRRITGDDGKVIRVNFG